MLDVLWQELTSGLHDSKQLAHVIIRLVAATLFGAIVGIQRESTRKPAGLRTHILVSLATAAFVISCSGVGMSLDGLSRVIQGIVTGIGFIGAGSILKLGEQHEIRGLNHGGQRLDDGSYRCHRRTWKLGNRLDDYDPRPGNSGAGKTRTSG